MPRTARILACSALLAVAAAPLAAQAQRQTAVLAGGCFWGMENLFEHVNGVSQLVPFGGFYRAEEYHQDFAIRKPTYPYIVINDLPKVDHLHEKFPQLFRDTPVRVSSR